MGSLVLAGATSGSTTITPTDAVTATLTLPSTGGTLQTSGAGFTTNGVAYATSTSALATGSILQFTSNGLGIGAAPNTSPGGIYYNLNVGTQGGGGIISAGTDVYLTSNLYITGGINYFAFSGSASGSYYNQSGGNHIWKASSAAGTGGSAATLNEQMRLTNAGNLGIGTIAPSNLLTLNTAGNDTMPALGANGGKLGIFSGSLGYGLVVGVPSSGTATLQSQYINGTASALDMALQPLGGNLFVGTTGQRYSTCKLVVEMSTSTNAGAFLGTKYSGDLSQAAVYISKYDNDNTTSQVYTRFIYNNILSGGGQINGNGASQAAFGSWSDSRLKENIVDLPSQLPNILALRPVEFNYIESEGGGHQVGFIAQEVKEIYPDLVGQRADGMFTLSDMNKNDARLIKAIQELSALVTAQSATITSLTERITALEGK